MKIVPFTVVFVILCSAIHCQNLSFSGILPAISQTGRISERFNYNIFISNTFDAYNKNINNVEYPATDLQFYFQPSIIYLHSPNINFASSITYQRNNPFNGNFVNEVRLWQQCIFSAPVLNGRLINRFRFEERFIQDKVTDRFPFSTRARYQLGINFPLQGQKLDANEFYINAYNEFYISLSGAKNALFSENWTYGGVGYNFGKLGRFEMGFLYQVAVRNKQKDLRILNLIQLMWLTNIHFRK